MTRPVGYRIACDVGGTFTDLAVLAPTSEHFLVKVPTTTKDGGLAGIEAALSMAAEYLGLVDAQSLVADCDSFVHATTRALNAVLERKLAQTALLTTAGHRDILVLREGGKPVSHSHLPYPVPLVPRRLTIGISERVGSEGQVVRGLDEAQAREAISQAEALGAEALAVCFLWSVVNPEHEVRMAELIEEIAPDVPYTLSHRVNPVIREYRRAASTVLDAGLKPLMQSYLAAVEEMLTRLGFVGSPFCVTSAGTMLPLADAASSPVHCISSGPALAPVASRHFVESSLGNGAADTLVVVDAGGTSFDVSLVRGGQIALTGEFWTGERFLSDLVGLSAVDVKSIGAGGGSVAWLDGARLLRVGPQSAGAIPGPACYGLGGEAPTVTDAALVLGYLDAGYFLGGRVRLHEDLARHALESSIGRPLQLSAVEAADALLTVSDQQMGDAIEEITVNRGLDPRQAILVAGGGASGYSIDRIARAIGCPMVLIPRASAGLSACGGIVCDVARDFSRPFYSDTRSFDFAGVAKVFEDLEREGEKFLLGLGVPKSAADIRRYGSARYAFQRWELEVPLKWGRLSTTDELEAFVDAFHSLHEDTYGVGERNQHLECVSWRARVTVLDHTPTLLRSMPTLEDRSARSLRPVYFRDHGLLETPALGAAGLTPGKVVIGPAVVEAATTSIVVQPGSQLRVLERGDFSLRVPTTARDASPTAIFPVPALYEQRSQMESRR